MEISYCDHGYVTSLHSMYIPPKWNPGYARKRLAVNPIYPNSGDLACCRQSAIRRTSARDKSREGVMTWRRRQDVTTCLSWSTSRRSAHGWYNIATAPCCMCKNTIHSKATTASSYSSDEHASTTAKGTRNSAIAEGPRDALSGLNSCQLVRNCTKNRVWKVASWNFIRISGIKKLYSPRPWDGVDCVINTFSRFDRTPACDGQIDGQTQGHYTALA